MFVEAGFQFPVADGSGQGWVHSGFLPFNCSRLTVAVQLRLFRRTARFAFQQFDMDAVIAQSVSLVRLGYSMSSEGVVIGCDFDLRANAKQRLMDLPAAVE